MMTMKNILSKTIILFGLALVFSCSQDPIFFKISTETAPVKPRIPGGPTNMVVFNSRMYVASGKLFSYNSASGWDDSLQPPGGKVKSLAATTAYLYALCLNDSGVSTLRRIGTTGEWDTIGNAESTYTLIQSIYATTGRLFAGARNNSGSDYGILSLADGASTTLQLINGLSNTEMLSGAARKGTSHYLSTMGKGVYKIDEADLSANNPATQLGGSENELLMGMIQLEDGSIIVIKRNGGTFFEIQADEFKELKYSDGVTVATGRFAIGALALWQQNVTEGRKLLIAGIQGDLSNTTTSSSYTNGYVEFDLKSDGSFDIGSTRRDYNPSLTVDGNTDRYTATIGKHPINHLYQAPPDVDTNRTFFASTQAAGLWSYRDRTGGLQWNAEN